MGFRAEEGHGWIFSGCSGAAGRRPGARDPALEVPVRDVRAAQCCISFLF